jgi:hypothetical protein
MKPKLIKGEIYLLKAWEGNTPACWHVVKFVGEDVRDVRCRCGCDPDTSPFMKPVHVFKYNDGSRDTFVQDEYLQQLVRKSPSTPLWDRNTQELLDWTNSPEAELSTEGGEKRQ